MCCFVVVSECTSVTTAQPPPNSSLLCFFDFREGFPGVSGSYFYPINPYYGVSYCTPLATAHCDNSINYCAHIKGNVARYKRWLPGLTSHVQGQSTWNFKQHYNII